MSAEEERAAFRHRTFGLTCPHCGEQDTHRESVDVGIGIMYGPWGCPCGWSEDEHYDQTNGPTRDGSMRTDQWGWGYPGGGAVVRAIVAVGQTEADDAIEPPTYIPTEAEVWEHAMSYRIPGGDQ